MWRHSLRRHLHLPRRRGIIFGLIACRCDASASSCWFCGVFCCAAWTNWSIFNSLLVSFSVALLDRIIFNSLLWPFWLPWPFCSPSAASASASWILSHDWHSMIVSWCCCGPDTYESPSSYGLCLISDGANLSPQQKDDVSNVAHVSNVDHYDHYKERVSRYFYIYALMVWWYGFSCRQEKSNKVTSSLSLLLRSPTAACSSSCGP